MNLAMEAVSSENGKKVVKVTLRQVAKLAGVSLTTASRVLNGHANVSTQVRERVWRVINENGYQPDQAARSLAARRAKKNNDYFLPVYESVSMRFFRLWQVSYETEIE